MLSVYLFIAAAGSTGAELLFQATSEEMIDAYSRVPYPMGTVVAADIFKTGIMLSEYVSEQILQDLS
jgi:Zn-dependent M28 family amino/carboxypeptidase